MNLILLNLRKITFMFMTVITIITVITFDDKIQKTPNAKEERETLREEAVEITGSTKKNVFMIANWVDGNEDHDSEYKKHVLEMLERALKCGERTIRMQQTSRERPKKQTGYPESNACTRKAPGVLL